MADTTIHGVSTADTFLMKKASGSSLYEKIIDIISYPDMGGEPEQIDITTLSDHMRRSIPGIQEVEGLTFEANYTPANYAAVKALDGVETEYAVWYGIGSNKEPDGHDGKFSFSGKMTSYATGGGVNEARRINCTIMPSTEIEFTSGT